MGTDVRLGAEVRGWGIGGYRGERLVGSELSSWGLVDAEVRGWWVQRLGDLVGTDVRLGIGGYRGERLGLVGAEVRGWGLAGTEVGDWWVQR